MELYFETCVNIFLLIKNIMIQGFFTSCHCSLLEILICGVFDDENKRVHFRLLGCAKSSVNERSNG